MKSTVLNYLLILIVFPTVISCTSTRTPELENIEVEWSDGSVRPVSSAGDSSIKVFIFMAPECPLCINFTQTINQLADTFARAGIKLTAVYPGNYYSVSDIKEFEEMYGMDIPSVYDTRNEVARALDATVTPQAVLLNSRGEIVYSGAIDNRGFAPGKKRQNITEHYLKNALLNVIAGKKADPAQTEAIGCFIEF